jgi:hypothetical protein
MVRVRHLVQKLSWTLISGHCSTAAARAQVLDLNRLACWIDLRLRSRVRAWNNDS